jgi:hypothetical protein
MRAFRPIDHLFLLTLCGLLFVVIVLQYYRPSSYLPQHQPKPATYQSDDQDLNKVFQLAENWDHAHEVEEPLPVLPTIPEIPTEKEIERKLLQEQVPEIPYPQINFEEDEKNKAEQVNSWVIFYNTIVSWLHTYGLWAILIVTILIFIYFYIRSSPVATSQVAQREINAIPLGVKRKQYQIAGDFQVDTVAKDWMEEIHQQEMDYVLSHSRDGNFEVRYEDYLKMQVEEFESIEKQRPKHSSIEKAVHPIKKWLNPDQALGESFEYEFKWSDVWASLSSAGYNALIYLLTPDDIRFVWLYVTLYFTLFFISLGAFRRSRWAYILGGITFTIVGSITALVIWIYNYIQAHPELLEVDQNSMNSFYRNLAIGAGALVGLFLLNWIYRYLRKSKFGSKLKYWTTEAIWLKDASMGNLGLLFLALAFILGRLNLFIGFSYILSNMITTPFWAAGIINIGLWLFSPTPKQSAEEQWKLYPYQLLILLILSTGASGFLLYYRLHFGFFWALAPVPAISAIAYFLRFHRMDKMPYLLEKDEKQKDKKNLVKTVEAVEMDAKKIIRKSMPKISPTPPPDDRWWDVEKPEAKGLLHLENRMLRNTSLELDKLVKFKQLRFLYLKNNLLEFFPEEIIWLKKLQKLDLSDNKIGIIPPQIIVLKQLSVLELANNEIRSLPPWIEKMDQLKVLNIRGNMIPKAQIDRLQKQRPDLQIEWE